MKHFFFFLLLINTSYLFAQEKTSGNLISEILGNTKFISVMDFYYSYDFATNQNPKANERRLAASAPFNNEFRLNYFSFELQHKGKNFRTAGGLHFGDIPQLLTPVEKQAIRTVKKAYFGYRIGETSWIDFGYMGSPFGFEGIGLDNWLTNISVAAYCEPGNILGIRYSSELSKEFYYEVSLHNSYNILSTNNTNKSIGISVNYKPTEKIVLTYSNEIGDEGENFGTSYFRIFNNFIFSWKISEFINVVTQFDYAMQANSKKNAPDKPASFYSGVLAMRFSITEKLKFAMMGDYMNDPDGFITEGVYQTNKELKTYSAAAGIQYYFLDNSCLKLEYQYTEADQEIFVKNSKRRNNVTFSTSIKLTN